MPKPCLTQFLSVLAVVATALGLSGCLYTTHHFNNGRLLEPGETAVTLGAGRAHFYSDECPDYYARNYNTPSSAPNCISGFDSVGIDTIAPRVVDLATPKMSLGYRLGIRKQWGPLTGLDMGWSVEVPTNPATIEFDLRAGLPLPKGWPAAHSLSGGWGVGMWADNSWFLEYAASRIFGPHSVYANYRYTWLASQPEDLDSSFNNWKFVSHRRIVQQGSLGFFYRMPDILILPDYLSPELVLTVPLLVPFSEVDRSLLEKYQLSFNFGFGWNF